MGCAPLNVSSTSIKPVVQGELKQNSLFTIEERLKLKEVWVVIKQENLKKISDQIMDRVFEKKPSLIDSWHNIAIFNQNINLNFADDISHTNVDMLLKELFKQHGYKMIDKIDQLIMVMVASGPSNNNLDNSLNQSFNQLAKAHLEYKIQQDDVDLLCECFIESLRNVMFKKQHQWTIRHELTWIKLFTSITDTFSTAKSTIKKPPS